MGSTELRNGPGRQRRGLLAFLSVATFFEGYDLIALVQVLPRLVKDMRLDEARTGLMVGIVNIGAIAAFAVVRLADRFGRRPILMLTIVGYTLGSFATGLTGSAWSFAALQLIARAFLLAEFGISMVYAAEELPEDRRGRGLGLLQAASTLGTIVCAGLAPGLMSTSLGWRAVYFVGTIPLLLMAFARRSLRETRRFEERAARRGSAPGPTLLGVLRGPYRNRLLLLGGIWGLTYFCAQSLITFWNIFAVQSRGLTLEVVSRCIMIAAVASLPLIFGVGRLLERGRRSTALIVYVLLSLSAVGCYGLADVRLLTVSLTLAIFSITGVVPVMNAFTTELFPTEIRADAFGWSNNLLGRVAYVLSPVLVGFAARRVGYGPAIMATAIFPAIALVLILKYLPETARLPLEVTSRLDEAEPADGQLAQSARAS